ncbi:MAG: FAD-dependent oxidoreductase [Bacteroidota bacterium]
MLDYLVIGGGLAGISFCEVLRKQGLSFKMITDTSQQASLVAGGLYNPVILKRFTLAWNTPEQMQMALPFYEEIEQLLSAKLDYKIPVLRRFASIEEQNLWFEACDKPFLSEFLSPEILSNTNPQIDAPFGLGQVLHTGRVDTKILLEKYQGYLEDKGALLRETVDYDGFDIAEDRIAYNNIHAKKVVFADGFGLKQNPFFAYLPLNGTKGELLTIHASDLKETSVIKSSVFIIPLGDDLYRVGATYKWKDKTNVPTEASKDELLTKLRTFLKSDFEVHKHVAGIRPTVTDRRPLVGTHPQYKNLFCLNGFGSRGVLIAPYAAQQLFHRIEKGAELNQEMDIARFQKHYEEAP